MEYKGQAIQCRNLDKNIVELIFDSQVSQLINLIKTLSKNFGK